MNKRQQIILLTFLIFLLFVINYRTIDGKITEFLKDYEYKVVERIIDGDTIVVENNTHIRLLGINTPEKGEKYYNEAGNFLKELISNKTIRIEYGKERYDKYKRTLAYVIFDGKNINIEQIRNGFANAYIYDNDEYTNELRNAWKECIASGKNLCEKSNDECATCVELKSIDVKSQKVVLHNNCNFNCELTNWEIKDEGRKKFVFQIFILKENAEVSIIVGNKTDTDEILYWKDKDYVWTAGGDTLFLRDREGKLVLWKRV
ncbi:MAG: thermonuclease family protein [Nanoarchaeota archaeon]